jgi:uncharacterized protein (TIGR04222 family)
MSVPNFRRCARLRPSGALALVLVLMFSAAIGTSTSLAFQDVEGSTGLHDTAGVLSADEQAEIEQAIADVEAAGAPAVVYLRLLSTEDDQAVDDARELMEAWDIESAPGARDGFVIFLNLEPDDPDRGELGIVAGEEHFEDGALPQSEINRIRDEMIDHLADDEMAEGILTGLELTAERLVLGPPEPTAFETFLERIGSGPTSLLNIVSVVAAMLLGMIGWRSWRDRPQANNLHAIKTTEPPSDLHPALASSLVDGSVGTQAVEAMLLELVRQGALEIEQDPEDDEKVQIRVINSSLGNTRFERKLLEILANEAENGVLDQERMVRTQAYWSEVQTLARQDLEESGLFDPDASRRRTPLFVTGIIALLLAVAAFLPLPVIEEPWGLIGAGILGFVGAFLVGGGASFPRTTYEGERQAMPWRGYRDGLKDVAKQEYGVIDLDEAFPYIVALNVQDDFKDHLEQASEAGYVPQWIRADESDTLLASNWFVYWIAFHGVVHPHTTSSGASMPGGAATGSGGAGGRF